MLYTFSFFHSTKKRKKENINLFPFVHFMKKKWSVIYFENHVINVDGNREKYTEFFTSHSHTNILLVVGAAISIGTGFSAFYYCYHYYAMFLFCFCSVEIFCANFNCDLLLLYSHINCNIWRMNNVIHERAAGEQQEQQHQYRTQV